MKRFIMIFTLFICMAGVYGADADYTAVSGGVRYQLIGTYSIDRLNLILTSELDDFTSNENKVVFPPAKNAVKLFRVIYNTVIPEQGNRPVEASGLLAVPDTSKGNYPMVSYQHGTVFSKNEVPSYPDQSMETRLMIAQFAGNGYIVIGADYIGKGVSPVSDTFMVKESIAQACLDMLIAAKAVLKNQNIKSDELFVSGWSQGSWNTMIFRNKLESLGIPVKAAATACTPSDVYLMLTSYINNPNKLDAAWLTGIFTLIINAYESYYDDMEGLSSVAIRPKYLQTARDFYNNKIGWTEASKVFPQTVAEFLQPEFAAHSSMISNRFFKRVHENGAYQWRYLTPSRYYYGKVDEVIRPYVAILPVEYQKTIGGASAEAVYAGDNANHRGTFIFGVLDQKKWFDRLLESK
ncbi:MAG: hypothetical protein WC637_12730 [Victivallales bacterium]